MINGSLDLLEPTSVRLMAIHAYFIMRQLKETHWIEASKTIFKHDIIFWLPLLLLLEISIIHLYLLQEVILGLLTCLNEELMSSNRIRITLACLNSISKSLNTLTDPITIFRILGHVFKFLQQLSLSNKPFYKYRYILPIILLQGFIILAVL
jgi:hypothetical protein